MFPSWWLSGADRHSEVDLSQAARDAASKDRDGGRSSLIGHMQGTAVGHKQYKGVVNQGEMVGLVRQRQNPRNRKAVMVTNIYGNQVGQVKEELAEAMSHIMDNNLAEVEGVVHSVSNNSHTMPLKLSFWGKEENKTAVEKSLTRRGFKLNTVAGKATDANTSTDATQTSQVARALLTKKGLTVPITAEELKNAFDKLFDGLMDSEEGEKEGAETVSTPLMPHQKQALSWMCVRENKEALPPFWEQRGELYYNNLTSFSGTEMPQRIRGGILADDMGLGKTLTTIALILTNFHEGKPLPLQKCDEQSSVFFAQITPEMFSQLEDDVAAVSDGTSSQPTDIFQVDSVDLADVSDESKSELSSSHLDESDESRNELSSSHLDESGQSKSELSSSHLDESDQSRNELSSPHLDESDQSKNELSSSHLDESDQSKNELSSPHLDESDQSKNEVSSSYLDESDQSKNELLSPHLDESDQSKNEVSSSHLDESDQSTSQGTSVEAPGGSVADTSLNQISATPAQLVDLSINESEDDFSARTTLIICPLSVISNWLDQFQQHVRNDVKINVYLYYGTERNKDEAFLASQDAVITTYNILSADFGKKSPLHEIKWLRVVLDEGHVVRNPKAHMSKAVLGLKAQRRWVLSGTPIQNSVMDLWMLLAFLRLKPFDAKEWWNRVIQRPVNQGDRTGLKNLKTLVKCVTLRRTKATEVNGAPLVSMPEKTVCVEQVVLTQSEREEYDLLRTKGKSTIGRYVSEGTVLRNYADVLSILMRLRQHCCHPDLLPKITADPGAASTPAEVRERLIGKLRLVLSSGSDEECSICLHSLRLPVITHCAHVFCRSCIARVIGTEQETASCPLCQSEIKVNELVEFPPQEMEEEKNTTTVPPWRTSSKVQALMGNLLRMRSEDSSIKSLIVSQFTRFLTLLETPLRAHGFSFVRFDGTMTRRKRTRVIQQFQNPAAGSPVIMLLSLKAGGVGLNLTAASHVYFMDPAWNPATEEQCIDRCHRLGQTRHVFVTKFIVKDSVEENMVKIQKHKQKLVEKAFGSKSPNSKTARVENIKALMEL